MNIYIVVMDDEKINNAQIFDIEINKLTKIIGKENIVHVYKMNGFRGLSAKMTEEVVELLKNNEYISYIELDGVASISKDKKKK